MFDFIKNAFSPKPKYRRIETERLPELLITEECINAILECIEPERHKGHEGVSYIYGRTDGISTLAIGAIRPHASTTPGSFSVSTTEMARLVKKIRSNGLQLICQLHTHPGKAYHSDGDVDGLKLICEGYVSIVLPSYGSHFPSFKDAAFFFYKKEKGFIQLKQDSIKKIPKRIL